MNVLKPPKERNVVNVGIHPFSRMTKNKRLPPVRNNKKTILSEVIGAQRVVTAITLCVWKCLTRSLPSRLSFVIVRSSHNVF